jgi:hypothetical protein
MVVVMMMVMTTHSMVVVMVVVTEPPTVVMMVIARAVVMMVMILHERHVGIRCELLLGPSRLSCFDRPQHGESVRNGIEQLGK